MRREEAGAFEAQVAAVRRFNRFYTQKIGVLTDGLLKSPFSLTEARVLFELAQAPARKTDAPTAAGLGRRLGLDKGYLSRLLQGLEGRGLLARTASRADGRQSHLALTPAGRAAFASLDARSGQAIGDLLGRLPAAGQGRLVAAMRIIEDLLGEDLSGEALVGEGRASEEPADVVLRSPGPGDLGWIVERHGLLYAAEYGFDERFEGLVAGIVATFAARHEPARERAWIAACDGRRLGSVLLVRAAPDADGEEAQLRLLLVEPEARGQGIGRRLVDEAVGFARNAGYRRLTLWTNDILHAARRLYVAAGFRLIHEAPHRSFGRDLVGQTWELRW